MNSIKLKKFALKLMDWHGGMSSGVYAVSSCMFSDAEKGNEYYPNNHFGHGQGSFAVKRAITELRRLKADANFPSSITPKDERECNAMADTLEKEFLPLCVDFGKPE